ncbi:MAG TPA: helix-turn-helix transcriptional regulator [Verrucomicrobiae bacterium]|nr:helix-turn-helix transcriptional regulator [Verrucomicrobiae bacterium]
MQHAPKTLAGRLKWLRGRFGLSLEQFGKAIRVGKSYVSKLERGVTGSPSEHVLDAICQMFFVRRAWLTAGEGEAFAVPHLNEWPESKTIAKPFISEDDVEKPTNLHAFVYAGDLLIADRSPLFIAAAINILVSAPRLSPDLTIAVVKILSDELLTQLNWLADELDEDLRVSYAECLSNEGKLAVIAAEESKRIETWRKPFDLGLEGRSPIARNAKLDTVTASGNSPDVKPTMPALLGRLNKATAAFGMKSKLAKYMGVPLPNVSQWLSGEREPSGETTLRLLHWVEQQERKK